MRITLTVRAGGVRRPPAGTLDNAFNPLELDKARQGRPPASPYDSDGAQSAGVLDMGPHSEL